MTRTERRARAARRNAECCATDMEVGSLLDDMDMAREGWDGPMLDRLYAEVIAQPAPECDPPVS